MRIATLAVLILVSSSFVTVAQEPPPSTQPRRASTTQPDDKKLSEPVVTDHEMSIAGQPFKYSATTGLLQLKDETGKPRATVFFIAYQKDRPEDQRAKPNMRPVTFVFNGGPGAASIWLHMGCVGPMRVVLNEDGTVPAPPYTASPNPSTWLGFTDLVFIDPVGTGFSRPEPEKGKEFYGVTGDVNSVAEFIRNWITRYNRWPSPKFLAGESYGTTRAAGLSEYLHERYGIDLNGIVLVSTVLNFQTLDFDAGNDTGFPLFLPTYTATAHYHKKLPADLLAQDIDTVVAEAEAFAIGDYSGALMKGTSLSDEERAKVEEQLARYTGLPIDTIRKTNLRLSPFRFEKLLLADQRRIIGRMDGRITGFDADPLSSGPEFDPSLSGYAGPFNSTFNDYVKQQLKYESDINYEFLSGLVGPWDFGNRGNGYLNVATTLRRCMTKLPTTKVFLASGYYDLATPFFAADVTINQLPLSAELRANIQHRKYQGGHMMYLNEPAMEKLAEDVGKFYEGAVAK